MKTSLRQNEILGLARQSGMVTVEGLAAHFGVTLQTIRKDLSELDEAGRIERVHGGAVLRSHIENVGYEARRQMNVEVKSAIAARAAHDIPPSISIFLNIGTSTEAAAHALLSHENLTIITNNMNVANIMVANRSANIVVAGGVLRRADGGLVGDLARQAVEQFKADLAVIGCSAIDPDGDMLDYDLQEVEVSRAIIKNARQRILLVDSSKLERNAPAKIASLQDMDRVYTDRPFPTALAAKCAEWGTDIISLT